MDYYYIDSEKENEIMYDICTQLMRSGINKGVIYSKNAELLKAMHAYLDKVKVPCYSFDEEHNISTGYMLRYGSFIKVAGMDCIGLVEKPSDELVDIISEYENSTVFQIKSGLDIDCGLVTLENEENHIPIHLKNNEIKRMFLKAFDIADSEIDIISPWMNSAVVNEALMSKMENALKRGVQIHIIYGIKPDNMDYNLSRSRRSDEIAQKLIDRFECFGDCFSVKRDNIHYKLVLCDNKFKLEGGYNYLSFIGDYDNEDTRKEGSPYGTDVNEIQYLRKEYFSE